MAYLRCECENVLRNNVFPNTLEGEIKGCYEYTNKSVWECNECGRLWIDTKDSDGLTESRSYSPDDGKVGNLFNVGTIQQFEKYLKQEVEPHFTDAMKFKLFDRDTEEIEFLKSLVEIMSKPCTGSYLLVEIEKRMNTLKNDYKSVEIM